MAEPKPPPPRARLEAELREVKGSLAVLRQEAAANRGVMNRLVSVLNDLHLTIHDLRVELQHVRSERERGDRLAELSKAVTQGGIDG